MGTAGRDGDEAVAALLRPVPPPDAVLRYGGDADQVVDLRLPLGRGGAAPLVAVLHGGFWRPRWDRGHAGPMSAALATAGYAVATVEYRRTGRAAIVQDVHTALRALPRLAGSAAPARVDATRLVLVGHSAGGHLALWAAPLLATPVGVVALAAVCDLRAAERAGLGDGAVRDLLGGPAAEHPELDPARRPPDGVPTVLVHGLADRVVPAEQSCGYARGRDGVRLDLVPDAGHYALVDPASAAWPRVLRAVGQVHRTLTRLR